MRKGVKYFLKIRSNIRGIIINTYYNTYIKSNTWERIQTQYDVD
jgi:hypothetical protein